MAACFAMVNCGNPITAVKMADELMEELKEEVVPAGGIVDIVPKRKRTRSS